MTGAAIRRLIEVDGVLRGALARGIVNQRALARWLNETYALGVSEAAIASALRRVEVPAADEVDLLAPARRVLARAHVNLRSNLCSLTLTRTPDVRGRLTSLLAAVDAGGGDTLRILQSERAVKVILDEANLDAALQALGTGHVQLVLRDLSEVNVLFPHEAATTPGVVSVVTTTLAVRGINVAEFVSGAPEYHVFVHKRDALAAYAALSELCESSAAREPESRVALSLVAEAHARREGASVAREADAASRQRRA